jgi:Zn-dependent protease with chaperone function
MIAKIGLLLMIFAIPFIGACSSMMMQNKFDSIVHEAFNKNLDEEVKNGTSTAQESQDYKNKLSQITLSSICENGGAELGIQNTCAQFNIIQWIEIVSYMAAGIALLMLGFIFFSGFVSRFNRYLLLLLFKPGIYGTLLVSCILVLVNAGILLATLYFLPAIYLERIMPGLLIVIGLGALGGVFAIITSMFRMVRKVEVFEIGTQATEQQQPKLWEYIRKLANQVGTESPHNIIFGLEPNFYVTEANVNCFGTRLTGRTMYLSLPLLRILSEKELRSVIGHELGHFVGWDTRFSEHFYPIYRGTAEAIGGMNSITNGKDNDGTAGLALLPAIGMLVLFLDSFSKAESKISRERELAADSVGMNMSDAQALATALVKLHAFSKCFSMIQERNIEMLKNDGTYLVNQSLLFQSLLAKVAGPNSFENLNETATAHPTDSHPTLSTRLANLRLTIGDIQTSAMNLTPSDGCLNLIQDLEEIETHTSLLQTILLAKRLGINFNEKQSAGNSSEELKQN